MQLSRNASTALAIVGLSYWLIFGGTFAGSLSWLHQTIGHIFLVAVIAGAGWYLWRKNPRLEIHRPPTALCIPLGLILADKFVRALLRQSWNSAEDFASSVAGVVIFILLLNILPLNILRLNLVRDGNELTTICVPAVVASALVGMVLMFVKHDQELVYPLGSKVLMAGLLTLAIPLAMGRLRALFRSSPDRSAQKLFWLSSALILAVGLILTRSAIAIVLLPFALVLPLVLDNKRRGQVAAVLGLTVAILGAALYFGASGPLAGVRSLARVRSMIQGGSDSTQSWDNRVRYWSGALPAIAERPLAGWGSGQVGLMYPPFRIQRAGYAPSGEVVPDLHSVPLQWAYEFGLIGLTLRVAAFGVLLLPEYSRRTQQQKTAVIALGMYGVFCLLHYNLNNPATISMATLIAVMTVNAPAQWRPTIAASKRIGLVLMSVALALVSFQARLDYANYLLARSSHQSGNEGVESVLRAGLMDSRGGFYDAAAAFRIDKIIRDSGHDTNYDQPFLLRAAENHYRRALDANPQSPQLTAAYGDFLMRAKRPCDAIEILERAVRLDFYFSLSHFNLANAYAVCRSGSQAADEAGIAILAMPTLAYSTQWRNDPAFLERALDKSWDWISGWKVARWPEDVEKFRRLDAFVQAVRAGPTAGQRRVQIFLSEQIAPGLTADPFAYIFQRRSPPYGLTRVEIDGLDTGTWTPEGMGQMKSLRPLRETEIAAAYQGRSLDALMRSLDTPARQ
ncbi:MAG: O-antigen ligase family protein [Acidobacteriia bacterium]|nr:O-antigen ligase family protein [Terriglobia bacterium]